MVDDSAPPPAPPRRVCPVCGETGDDRARYCWNCGARLSSDAAAFTRPLRDAVPEQQPAAEPIVGLPPSSAEQVWTASPEQWRTTASDAAPMMAPAPAPRPTSPPHHEGTSRTVWIVLGILAAIVLLCCIAAVVLVAVASRDSAFQTQVSLYARR